MPVAKHVRMLNDTLTPLNRVLRLNGDPVDLSAYTVKFMMEEDDGTSVLAATATGVTAHPTQTFTAATTDIITCNGHGVKEGDQIVLSNSGGALPAGLATATRYFPREITPNTFKVSLTPNGGDVDITGTGTGTHSFYVVGSVQYDFLAATVDEAGLFRGWFQISASSETMHFPDDEYGIPIEVKPFGN